MVFPVVSHVWMWELHYKESWAPKNWCFWTVVLEKTLESPLDCKEIQPVHPRGDQSWVFIGRTDVETETPILWPPEVKSWLIWKDSDVGKDWGQEEKGTTEDEMVGWHQWLNGHGFGWTLGVGDGQGGLACCGSWGRKESDTTEQLNWTEFTLIHGTNIPGSCAILLFTPLNFTFTTSHIHNWTLSPLWLFLLFLLELFIRSSPVAYWALTDLRSSSFSVMSFCLFILDHQGSPVLRWTLVVLSFYKYSLCARH